MKLHALCASAIALTLAFSSPARATEENLFVHMMVVTAGITLRCPDYEAVKGGVQRYVADFLFGVDVNPDCCHRITAEGQDGHSLPSQFSLLPNLSQALLQAFKLRTDLRFHGVS